MKRKPSAPVFKPYIQNQISLIPRSYDEIIPKNHIVHVVSDAIDSLDLSALEEQYKGGGTSSYHPRMMLKVLVYAYTQRVYTSRQIAKQVRENLYYLWLSGNQTPDFRTINNFRGSRMRDVIEDVFGRVVEYLVKRGFLAFRAYFLDGTKIEANANKHKVVWAKRNKGYSDRLRKNIRKLFEEIEHANEEEQAEYGDHDLAEMGEHLPEGFDSEELREHMEEANQALRAKRKPPKAALAALRKLKKDCLPRLRKYEEQEKRLAGRSNYSKTDPEASCMRMKEDRGAERPWPKPAYNVQAGTEGQYVVGFSVHNRVGDPPCLVPHVERMRKHWGRLPERMVGDAAYGSEENYAYLERNGIGNYLKYTTFYQDTHRYRKPEILEKRRFLAEQFPYDESKDEYVCPAGKRLAFQYASRYTSDNGHVSERRTYGCKDCPGCPLKAMCTKAKGCRNIRVSPVLQRYREEARRNLTSKEGERLRAERSTEVETVFGDIKQNMRFRRFHLRGEDKVRIEWGLVCLAHNMRKMAAN